MTLAVIYDVHGNLPALEAVLADAEAEGASRFILGGDYALFGPWPRETVDRLGQLESADWIRGNGERWTAHPHEAPDDQVVQQAVAACREALGEATVARLAALPEEITRDGVLYCHASPVSDVRSFMPDHTDDEDELLADVRERRLVFGHTHLPFKRMAKAGIELVNPGSVGMPFDGDTRAAYALVREGNEVEHRRAEYDVDATVAAVRERFDDPFADTVARRIESGRFQHPR